MIAPTTFPQAARFRDVMRLSEALWAGMSEEARRNRQFSFAMDGWLPKTWDALAAQAGVDTPDEATRTMVARRIDLLVDSERERHARLREQHPCPNPVCADGVISLSVRMPATERVLDYETYDRPCPDCFDGVARCASCRVRRAGTCDGCAGESGTANPRLRATKPDPDSPPPAA